jgi:hypothetical protein
MPAVVDQEEMTHNKALKKNIAITTSINAKANKEAVTGTTVNSTSGKKDDRSIRTTGTGLPV